MTTTRLIGSSVALAIVGLLVSGVLVSDVGQSTQVPPGAVGCRHDASERPSDLVRREQAVALAHAINVAQRLVVGHTHQYQPLDQLGDLPPTPDAFEVSLYTDGSGYIFSVKDERDPCHYRIFSEQDGRLYEVMLDAAEIAS